MRRESRVRLLSRTTVQVLVTGVFLAGCRGGESRWGSEGFTVRVDSVNGYVRVLNQGPGPKWNLVATASIGGAGGLGVESPSEFGEVRGVVATEDGTSFVADGMASEIRAFDPGGRFLSRIGRTGEGPGEFRSIQSLGMLGDTLVVLDPRNGRLGLMSRDGGWMGQRRYLALFGPRVRIYRTHSDEFYAPALRGGGADIEVLFVRHTHGGAADSLPAQRDAEVPTYSVLCQHHQSPPTKGAGSER
jgi:hypothetical protein